MSDATTIDTVEISELPRRLEELLGLAAAGRTVVLADAGRPRARLLPITPVARVPGLHTGAIVPSADFDAPLPDDLWTHSS